MADEDFPKRFPGDRLRVPGGRRGLTVRVTSRRSEGDFFGLLLDGVFREARLPSTLHLFPLQHGGRGEGGSETS